MLFQLFIKVKNDNDFLIYLQIYYIIQDLTKQWAELILKGVSILILYFFLSSLSVYVVKLPFIF